MPAVSLVVCVHKERDLLERLLREAQDCYDDLVVIHDGSERDGGVDDLPKPAAVDYARQAATEAPSYQRPSAPPADGSVHALVEAHGGRYFEGGRSYQQEPHWPFAWSQARHDWILRLDADEFPSAELKAWLRRFREQSESPTPSGYSCIWPLWNGSRTVTQRWPGGRVFLFDRTQVSFFGMVEQVPVPDGEFQAFELTLHHQPKRSTFGVINILFRRQAYHWRHVIATSLLAKPTDLPRWRWPSTTWPDCWRQIRDQPLRTALRRMLLWPLYDARQMMRSRERPRLSLPDSGWTASFTNLPGIFPAPEPRGSRPWMKTHCRSCWW